MLVLLWLWLLWLLLVRIPGQPCAGHPLQRTPFRRTTQNFALCFPSPAPISFFCLSLGVFSLNFGGVFGTRTLKCACLEFSGCCVETRRLRENSTRRHPEREKERNGSGGEGKKTTFWAVRRRGVRRGAGTTPPTRTTTNDQRPTTNDQQPTTNDQRPTTNNQQQPQHNMVWPKLDWPKKDWPKVDCPKSATTNPTHQNQKPKLGVWRPRAGVEKRKNAENPQTCIEYGQRARKASLKQIETKRENKSNGHFVEKILTYNFNAKFCMNWARQSRFGQSRRWPKSVATELRWQDMLRNGAALRQAISKANQLCSP